MTTLDWTDLRKLDLIERGDNAGRIYPVKGSIAEQYINEGGYRSPSRSWPYSYAKPLMTKKFIKWVMKNHPNSTVADWVRKQEEN